MRPRRLPHLLGTALVVALRTAPAFADDPAAGRALFDEGVALAKEGRWLEACPKFEASLQAYPGIGTRGKLADCYEKTGRVASAWATWKEVAALAMRAGDPTREQIASERAKALETKVSYLKIVVEPAHATPGLSIRRNGKDVDPVEIGQAQPFDPGPVTIDVHAPGKKPVTAHVLVSEGQMATYEVPSLEGVTTPAPAPPPSRPATAPPPAAERRETPWQKPVGLGVAGLGVVAVGVGAALGLSAKSTYDDAFDRGACSRGTRECNASGQNDIEDARAKATTSTIAFVAGGVLAAGGLVLFFSAPSRSAAALSVAPGPHGAALTFSGPL